MRYCMGESLLSLAIMPIGLSCEDKITKETRHFSAGGFMLMVLLRYLAKIN